MRKRINSVALCSSNNYRASRHAHEEHVEMLRRNHEDNKKYLMEVAESIKVKVTITYTEVCIFGKWIKLDGANPDHFKGFKLR